MMVVGDIYYEDLSFVEIPKERATCSVRAVTACTGLPYLDVHAAFEECGRRKGCATPYHITEQAISRLGYKKERWTVNGKTIRTVERELPDTGAFLIRVRGHHLARVDGVTLDSAAGRCKRIRTVYRIVKR